MDIKEKASSCPLRNHVFNFKNYDLGYSGFESLVFPEHAFELEIYHPEHGFLKNASAHFGLSFSAVSEDDGYFHNTESQFPCRKFHFDLEGITRKAYFI